MRYLLFIFIAMPIVEMWLLITVGREIGPLPTIALVLLTAMVGVSLLRQQGFATLFRARQKMDSGQLPAIEMVEAIILAVCGALLLTPGFVTDVVGFVGLIPAVRRIMVTSMVAKMQVVDFQHQGAQGGHSQDRSQSRSGSETVDGEYWRDGDGEKHQGNNGASKIIEASKTDTSGKNNP